MTAAIVGAFLVRSSQAGVPMGPGAVAPPEAQAHIDAHQAQEAAESAKDAAALANQVAQQSVETAQETSKALKHARKVLKEARAASKGLSPTQQAKLKAAEAHLVSSGEALAGATAPDAEKNDIKAMQDELAGLKKKLKDCEHGEDKSLQQMDRELEELQEMLKQLEEAEKASAQGGSPQAHDELKIEIQHLRDSIDKLEKHGHHTAHLPKTVEAQPAHGQLRYRMAPHKASPKVQLQPLADDDAADEAPVAAAESVAAETDDAATAPAASAGCTQAPCGSIDIDTEMPYGELEAFGREDTAQELTEASIKESDAMVDQLERAEVAEEKRAVFRALTRLRGAAITSFDGVARSQTGNIDEYNKVHKWRNTHPLRHLADEESDISKWAFPDNADF